MPKVATISITFITLLLAFFAFLSVLAFNMSKSLMNFRLIGWNYLPLCQLPQRATFCFRNTLYVHFAECLCAFHLVNVCRARRLSIPLYRFVDTKIHIKLHLSSTFTIFNITLTFVYN